MPGNIFFSYIGRAAKFPAGEIKYGAGWAGKNDPAHVQGNPEYVGPYNGVEDYSSLDPRDWNYGDEAQDNVAVTFGIKLWDSHQAAMTLSQFESELVSSIDQFQHHAPDVGPVASETARNWPYTVGYFRNRGRVFIPPHP